MHRVDDGRKGPCLDCVDRLATMWKKGIVIKPAAEEQLELFK
jgi:hypothetical protein